MELPLTPESRARVERFQRTHRIGLVTLVFTDILGSTRLKHVLGDEEGLLLIGQHNDIVRGLLARFTDSQEISTAGDSFFIVFTKPSDAVKFSLLLQLGLRELSRQSKEVVKDRIGIHVGEVFIEHEEGAVKDLYGLQVDTASRIMSLGSGDQILMSRFAFDSARQVLSGQDMEGLGILSWLNHGTFVVKGIEEPVDICEVGEEKAAELQPPPDSAKGKRRASEGTELVLGWRPAVDQRVPNSQWVLVEKLGEGSVGEVWMGRHQTLKEKRVFKFCFEAERVRSLKREVTLFKILKERVGEHPNIVGIREVYFDEPPFYIVMDYSEGVDLKTWCKQQGGIAKVPLTTRLELVAQVADGLQAAHDAGVIHRDVKPGNILVQSASKEGTREGDNMIRVRLSDFGIGQVIAQETLAGVTQLGFTKTTLSSDSDSSAGTHLYMAPELFAGQPATTSSDIYSLGIVLYQLLLGDLVHPLTTDWPERIDDHLLRKDLAKCFVGNPQGRFSSAGQLAEHLRQWEKRGALLAAQERKSYVQRIIKRNSIIGLFTVGLMLVLHSYPIGSVLVNGSYELLHVARGNVQVSGVALVDVDQQSTSRLDQPIDRPWSRRLHAQLVDRLSAAGAKAIVFDIHFSGPSVGDPEMDDIFAKSIKASGRVILAAGVSYSSNSGRPELDLPLDNFRTNAAGIGASELLVNRDMVVREYASQVGGIPTLAVAVAQFVKAESAEDLNRDKERRWMNYYGHPNFLPLRSYYEVLGPNADNETFFRDKIVFVGIKIRVDDSQFRFGEGHRNSFNFCGTEIQTIQSLNLLRGDWMTRLSLPTERIILLLTGIVFGVGVLQLRPLLAVIVGVACLGVVALINYFVFTENFIWFPWLLIELQIGIAIVGAFIVRLRSTE